MELNEFFKTLGLLSIAALLAAGTFFGPMWAVSELSKYSSRGKTELTSASANTTGTGLPKSYAFAYSNGILEPITMLVPNFYGGSSSNYLVSDPESKTYEALTKIGDQNTANQLAQYTSSYWGAQPLAAPYYGGAIVIFLFALGLLVAEKKYVWWLAPVSVFAVMLSWGSNFETFNYFLFDYLPGYNKFRSVTFGLIIVFFSLPLLGSLGLEKVLQDGATREVKKKLLIALGATGGLCLLFLLGSGMFSFMTSQESQLPAWFLSALRDDRRSLMRSDLIRSLAFIVSIFTLLYFNVPNRTQLGFFSFLILMVSLDLGVVDNRYFTKDNYQRKRDNSRFEPTQADLDILKDKSVYRVLNLANFYEANTSSFHRSVGGYHGVRLKRYQELIDSCIFREQEQFIESARQGNFGFDQLGVLNMLNTKYLVYGQDVIPNPSPNGVAWFVKNVITVAGPNEELAKTSEIDTKTSAVVDGSKFKIQSSSFQVDSLSSVQLTEQKPYWLKYETNSATDGLVVFSEIFYPKGWIATIDGRETSILRVNYVLRGLEVPAGKHVIEFTFQPKPYLIGNKITMASSWLLLLVVLGALGWNLKSRQ
jgi:Bacterial membrane protein YfhO